MEHGSLLRGRPWATAATLSQSTLSAERINCLQPSPSRRGQISSCFDWLPHATTGSLPPLHATSTTSAVGQTQAATGSPYEILLCASGVEPLQGLRRSSLILQVYPDPFIGEHRPDRLIRRRHRGILQAQTRPLPRIIFLTVPHRNFCLSVSRIRATIVLRIIPFSSRLAPLNFAAESTGSALCSHLVPLLVCRS